MAFFASDNTAGASVEIIEALRLANNGHDKAYGADAITERLTTLLRKMFNHSELVAFPVFNGSAANCLALAGMMRPYDAVIAHEHSHIEQDECGMPEFFTGGKVLKASGDHGKIEAASIHSILRIAEGGGLHHSRPKVISIAQTTEFGTVYTSDEIRALSSLAKAHGLLLHMDGARFANAVASLGCAPAEISWQAGVDAMSFGCTKNGAILAECVIFFEAQLAQEFARIRKRAGQLASKQRFISAQLVAMLEDTLWLTNATHANAMATRLKEGLSTIEGMQILNAVEGNAVFVRMPAHFAAALMTKGHVFYDWPLLGENTYRLVTSFSTTVDEVDGFLTDCKELAA